MKRNLRSDDIVDAYVKWAESSVDAWTTGAARMRDVGRSDTPGLDWFAAGSAWMADLTRAALDVYDTVCGGGRYGSSSPLVTAPYAVTARRIGITEPSDLRLAGPLQGMMSSQKISAGAVKIVPSVLRSDESHFRLEVWPGAASGDAYWGTVEVVLLGKVIETVDVVVQVP
jgi:hypothetical protein